MNTDKLTCNFSWLMSRSIYTKTFCLLFILKQNHLSKIVSEQNILLKKTLHLYKMVNSQIWFIKTHIKKSANTHRENVLKRKAEQEMLFQNSQHEQHFSCVHSEDQGISDSRCQRFEADKKWMWYEWPRQGVLCSWGINQCSVPSWSNRLLVP